MTNPASKHKVAAGFRDKHELLRLRVRAVTKPAWFRDKHDALTHARKLVQSVTYSYKLVPSSG